VTEAVRPDPASCSKCCLTWANVVGRSGEVQPVPARANEFIGKLIGRLGPESFSAGPIFNAAGEGVGDCCGIAVTILSSPACEEVDATTRRRTDPGALPGRLVFRANLNGDPVCRGPDADAD